MLGPVELAVETREPLVALAELAAEGSTVAGAAECAEAGEPPGRLVQLSGRVQACLLEARSRSRS
jgi:hypothetical protein